MVELLKKNAEKREALDIEKNGAKMSTPKSTKSLSVIFQEVDYEDLWKALNELGYDRGSDIPYFHFNECCEELNIDADSIDITKFGELYEVNIG